MSKNETNKKQLLGRQRFILFCILVLGLFLRLYRLPDRLWWSGDMGRDFLVATHISKYFEFPQLGHPASGFSSVFFYPPYWYYLLSIFTTFTSNPVVIAGINTIFQVMLMIVIFLIANHFGGKIAGYVTVLFYALASKVWELNISVWPVFVMPLFFFPGYYISLTAEKWVEKMLGYALMLFASTIHYSAMGMVVIVLLFDVITAVREKRIITMGMIILGSAVVGVYLYLPLFLATGVDSVIRHFVFYNKVTLTGDLPVKLTAVVADAWRGLFDGNRAYAVAGLLVFGFSVVFAYQELKDKFITRVKSIVFIVIVYITLLAVTSAEFWNYTILYTFLILLLGIAIGSLLACSTKRAKSAGLIFCIMMCWFLFNNGVRLTSCCGNELQFTKNTVDAIYQHAREHGMSNFLIIADRRDSGYLFERFAFWFFVEQKHGVFLRVSNIPDGLELIDNTPKPHYLVCINMRDSFTPECLRTHSTLHPTHQREKQLPSVQSDNYQLDIFLFAPENYVQKV